MPTHNRKSKTKVIYTHTGGSKHPNDANRGATHTKCSEPGKGRWETRCWACGGKVVTFTETPYPCSQGGN